MKDLMQNSVKPSVVAPVKRSVQSDVEIINSAIYAFTLHRSFISKQLVNVVAVDKKGELLATVRPNLTFDEGADMVELLNSTLKGE